MVVKAILADDDGLLPEDRLPFSIRGEGIDPTGILDSTAAINALLAAVSPNTVAYLPAGDYKVTSIDLGVEGVTLTGPGRIFSSISNGECIRISGNRCRVIGLNVIHQAQISLTKSPQTGAQQIAVFIQAQDVAVENCFIEHWQHGVVVSAFGEFYGARIHHNRIKDIVGGGDGPSTDPSGYGEDRGDGITVWGAGASIVGNIVNAKPGTDARIGIHVEALDVYEVTPGLHPDLQCTISGNVVWGKFRRGIVSEGVPNTTISSNSVADSTWWSICLARANNCSVVGNSVLWTRLASDNQGSAWSPLRAPLATYGNCKGSNFSDNTVRFTATSDAQSFILTQSAGGSDVATDCDFSGNIGQADVGAAISSMAFMENAIRCRLLNNKLFGVNVTGHGIYYFAGTDPLIQGNEYTGNNAFDGVHLEGSAVSIVRIFNNTIINFAIAISVINCTGGGLISGNVIRNGVNGLELFGSSGLLINDNMYKNISGTDIFNLGSNTSVNNITVA